MRLKVLGCYGAEIPGYNLSSFLVDGRLLLDAGSVSSSLAIAEQAKIDCILLTHVHLDHIRDISFLADNIFFYGSRSKPIHLCSIQSIVSSLKEHLFNDVIWPDFNKISNANFPIADFEVLTEGVPHQLGQYRVLAVRVNHMVEAVGFFVSVAGGSLLYTGDTGPTERIWEVAQGYQDLKAVIIETSFPNRLQAIADGSGHLTPQTLEKELAKLDQRVPVYLYHTKPQFLKEISEEVRRIARPGITILEQGKVYSW